MSIRFVEVAPRDGFQPIAEFIPTAQKIAFIKAAHKAGARAIEATAFVNPNAVPQLADAAEVLAATQALEGADARVLVPNSRGVEMALSAGARHLVYVFSASESHNQSNVRRNVAVSLADYRASLTELPKDIAVRLNLATSFDCPFEGRVAERRVLELLEAALSVRENIEVGLCDTTGRADPAHVASLVTLCKKQFGATPKWAFHGHDTYGLGVANIVAAWEQGVRIFDTALGGLGGCPFAPGATGNTATEDAVWMFERMGVDTGFDMDALLDAANLAITYPGACPGGRVRQALTAARKREAARQPA
ncbi:MAG: hydroxymethylglutaryl-CoA lyase [Caulobacterales bacterium]